MITMLTRPQVTNVNRTLSIMDLFLHIHKSKWLTGNGADVLYQFINLEIEGGKLTGILYLGDKLLDFEIAQTHIVNKSFRIGKYIFLLTSPDTLTVFINNDELGRLQL